MSKEQEYFNYYCLDKIKSLDNDFPISYSDDGYIRKVYYKLGLIAQVKKTICYILYTEDNFEDLIYIPEEYVLEHEQDLRLKTQNKEELFEVLKIVQTMNIFQFLSMLNFMYIYQDFKDIVDYNWDNLNMNTLIEM